MMNMDLDWTDNKKLFLIQVSEIGFNDVINGHYRNDSWNRKRRDRDQGQVEVGDLILFYFTGNVPDEDLRRQIRFISKVTQISDENKCVFQHQKVLELGNPLPLEQIREHTNNGTLSDSFNECGRQGFNIKLLNEQEKDQFLKLVKLPSPTGVIVGFESELEDFLVKNWNPQKFFGEKYKNLKILENENGEPVGQQYTIPVGRIDLLCKDEEKNKFVVIEIKKRKLDKDQVAGQIARYIGWVEENMAKGSPLEGIIICGGADDKLKYAAKGVKNCRIATYKINFEIKFET